MPTLPAVTMIYAAITGLLLVALALNVVRLRLGRGIGLGVGPEGAIEQPVRIHANFAENAPVFLVLLLLAEWAGLPARWLHLAGSVFVADAGAQLTIRGSRPCGTQDRDKRDPRP